MGHDTMGGSKILTSPTRVQGQMAEVNRARAGTLLTAGRPAWADDPTLDLPCQRPGVDPDWWFAAGVGPDERKARERAQRLCRQCPQRAACHGTALANREAWGVWGGVLFEYQPPGRDQGAAT